MAINTASATEKYRTKSIDVPGRRLLVTNFQNTLQEKDLSEPANCKGFGRIRHFRRQTSPGWPPNPLPIDPACRALNLPKTDILRAQAFQNAVCNWRCWYCFVPFDLLRGDPKHSAWLTPAELAELYLDQTDPPTMIDLTGGEPSIVPEWIAWMMDEFKRRELEHKIYLWSDDNLSNDYFWEKLTNADRDLIASYPMYGRVCCFKGFSRTSFAFNTSAEENAYDDQFTRMKRLATSGMDIYAYVTLTTPSPEHIAEDVSEFVARLQDIHPNLPLRTIPLEIRPFSPVQARLNDDRVRTMEYQQVAITAWMSELRSRYSLEDLGRDICDTPLVRTSR